MRATLLFVLALVHVVFAVAVWRAKSHSRINRLFALHTLPVAGWTFGIALLQEGSWLWAGNALTFASASLVPAGLLTFTTHYPRPGSRTGWERAAHLAGILFAMLSFTSLIAYDLRVGPDGPSRTPGIVYPLFVIYFMVVFASAIVLFARKWSRARGRERAQLNYYGVGLVVVAIFPTTANLLLPALTGKSSVTHWGPWFVVPLIVLTAHAIVRHRFLDLKIVIHRGMTASIAAVVSLLPFTILLVLVSGPTLYRFTFLETALLLGAAIGTIVLVPRIRQSAELILDRYVYRSTAASHRVLREASAALTHAREPQSVIAVTSEMIRVLVNPEGVSTFLEEGGRLKALDHRCTDEVGMFSSPRWLSDEIVAAASTRRHPILCDELDTVRDVRLHEEMRAESWAMVLPLRAGERLVGLVAVGEKQSGEPFYSQDIDALTTLANHAGSAVHNAMLHAEVVLANQYVANIVDAMQNGVVAIDRAATISLLNPAARHAFGLRPDGRPTIEDLPVPLAKLLKEVIETGIEHTTREFEATTATHLTLSLLCTASLLRDHRSIRIGAVAVFSDVTPSKELDRQRARAEKLTALQNLTYSVAHEIGNPLVPIKTMTKLLPSRAHDLDFVLNVARVVPRELERIERLVARLRRVAPRDELTRVRTDARIPIRHAVEVLEATATSQETQLCISLPDVVVTVLGDSSELEELFLNLLTNALEAVADQPSASRAIDVSMVLDGGAVVVRVSDSGPGISSELVDRIFDLFVTSKPRGSGLGLSICARITEAHGGKIAIANQPAGGAVVTVTLPVISP